MGSLQSGGIGAGLAFGTSTCATARGAGDGAVEALLRVEVPRVADQLLALQADVQAVTLSTMEQASVVADLGRHDMICMMTRDARDVGLLVVDFGLLTALVKIQTLGQVTSVPAKTSVPTRTDAVVVSDMLDKWMADVARLAGDAGLAQDVPFAGFVRDRIDVCSRTVPVDADLDDAWRGGEGRRADVLCGGDCEDGDVGR